MDLKIFLQEFREENWKEYVLFTQKNYTCPPSELQKDLDGVFVPQDIQLVLGYKLGDYAKDWLNKELLIIGGVKPIDLLKTEEGTKIFKEVLLRMPD